MSRGSGPRLAWSHGLPIMSALGLGWCHAVRVRVPPRSRMVSEGLGGCHVSMVCVQVSGDSGPWSPMVSSHQRHGLGRSGRLGPWSPTVSRHEHNGAGRVSRGSGPCSPSSLYMLGSMDSHDLPARAQSVGVTQSGFMVSQGPIMGLAGVTRPGSVIFMVSDHERQGRVSRAWVRGFPWSPIMSAVGLGGCHAVRVRGFP